MYKGIYIAASAALLKQKQLDVISQNLANADTVGFKKDVISFKDQLISAGGEGEGAKVMSALASLTTDFAGGSMIQTGNPLDIAIEGDGFIALEGGGFTRRGDMKKDKEGYLVAFNGARVLGNGGPIQIPEGEIVIGENGVVSVAGAEVDRISIRAFPENAGLTKAGGGVFTASEQGEESGSVVRQGALEKSNVEAITEMIRMIETVREFEAYQKAIQAFDEATGKVNNDLARI